MLHNFTTDNFYTKNSIIFFSVLIIVLQTNILKVLTENVYLNRVKNVFKFKSSFFYKKFFIKIYISLIF